MAKSTTVSRFPCTETTVCDHLMILGRGRSAMASQTSPAPGRLRPWRCRDAQAQLSPVLDAERSGRRRRGEESVGRAERERPQRRAGLEEEAREACVVVERERPRDRRDLEAVARAATRHGGHGEAEGAAESAAGRGQGRGAGPAAEHLGHEGAAAQDRVPARQPRLLRPAGAAAGQVPAAQPPHRARRAPPRR